MYVRVCMCTHVCMCVHMCVIVAQLCLTLCDPMDCCQPGSSVHEILQAKSLEWVAIPFSKCVCMHVCLYMWVRVCMCV